MGKDIKKKIQGKLPPIGWRIIKSALAVFLCYLVSFLRGNAGIVFYSQLAALWCIQVYVQNSKQNAVQRLVGTVIGALFGLLYLLIRNGIHLEESSHYDMVDAVCISLFIVVILYATVLLKKKQASYFSCVVFLSIVVNHVSDNFPYLFVWNRFLDTVIGIIIGIGINSFSLPRAKQRDILFISGLDDTLLNKKNRLSDYSKVELNRMLDDGANFTISTTRTPASLMEPMKDIRLKLPVIAMDGAVLFDIKEKVYLKVYVISNIKAQQLLLFIENQGLHCFANVIIDDLLVIYYDELEDEVQKNLVKKLRKSPYRNFVKRYLPEGEEVVYFMLLYPHDAINNLYTKLQELGITRELKTIVYPSTDYPGYSYLKIYNKNATKENMIQYLKEELGIQKTITFGNIPNRYDYVVEPGDSEKTIQLLKKLYEPVRFLRRS